MTTIPLSSLIIRKCFWTLVSGGSRGVPLVPPQRDPICSFLHTFPPKSTHVGGQPPPPTGQCPPPPTGNPGSAAACDIFSYCPMLYTFLTVWLSLLEKTDKSRIIGKNDTPHKIVFLLYHDVPPQKTTTWRLSLCGALICNRGYTNPLQGFK